MTGNLQTGDMVPNFSLPTGEGAVVEVAGYRGKNLVIFFYPKDDTPGCTKESIAFSQSRAAFQACDTKIVGISIDSPKSHAKFTEKHELTVTLASDEDKSAVEAFGVWVEKNMYGRKYMGTERATFLIDKQGKIAQIWRKVKVPGHVDVVLEAAQAL
ncbi:MAG: thioredoxin-dependent thiol peroxidase [Alphaproteobacteria bacterium]|nr:thioredoxin-dependent thiol peroxidase [Alphaproteobacteria bacterium]